MNHGDILQRMEYWRGTTLKHSKAAAPGRHRGFYHATLSRRCVTFGPLYLLVPDQERSRTYRKQSTTDRFLRTKCKKCAQFAHSVPAKTSKLPFFVGAGGFEPPASWSRKKPLPLNPAKIGHYSQNLVHQVHRVTQFHYSLVTVPIARHPCNLGWQGLRNEDGSVANYILREVRFAGRSPPSVFRFCLTNR